MTTTPNRYATWSNEQVLAEVERLAHAERSATAALLRALIELDTRQLYIPAGCASLFTYCTQMLHLAEGAAYNRIEAARAARKYPVILELLEAGDVTLTAVRLLAPHLNEDNVHRVLTAARHKTKRDIEVLVATLHPKPPVPTIVRKLPTRVTTASVSQVEEPATLLKSEPQSNDANGKDAASAMQRRRDVIAPLSAQHYKLQFTVSAATHEKLRRAQDLLHHTGPRLDVADVLDRALTLLVADLERRRFAATTRPRRPRAAGARSRTIPADVQRNVWQRDGGRCRFIGSSGRCLETSGLEYHHIDPYAAGGAATAANIQLRCRVHNQYEARLAFPPDADSDAEEVFG